MSDELKRLLEADKAAAQAAGQVRRELDRAEDMASLRRDALIEERRREAEKEMNAYERSLKDRDQRLEARAEEIVRREIERMKRVRDDSFETWVDTIVRAVIDDD